MSEYIKREDALKQFDENLLTTMEQMAHASGFSEEAIKSAADKTRVVAQIVVESINDIPAADVEPVVRGELRINEQGFLECSACGKTLRMPLVSTSEMKRCYICGAHMERSGSGE